LFHFFPFFPFFFFLFFFFGLVLQITDWVPREPCVVEMAVGPAKWTSFPGQRQGQTITFANQQFSM